MLPLLIMTTVIRFYRLETVNFQKNQKKIEYFVPISLLKTSVSVHTRRD